MKFSGITQNSIELRDMIEIETGSRIRIWRTNVIVAGFRKCRDLVGEGKVFVKNKAMVASRVGCNERGCTFESSTQLNFIKDNCSPKAGLK